MKTLYLRNYLFALTIFVSILTTQAQSILNYSFTATSGTYTALSGSTAPTFSGGSTNDGWYNSIPIGFEFWFMGTRYDNVGASTNGWFTFGLGSTSITNAVAANSFSSNAVPKPFVAPLWDDLDFTQSLGMFSYKTTGTAPNRIFTAEWLNAEWGWSANDSVISFQVKLYETSGKVDFIYRQENSAVASGSASIGIEGASTFQSLNGTGTSPSSSTTTSTNNLSTKPASGQIYSFTPLTPAAPTGLSFTSVTQNSMTVNWTDNATNEFGYVIYISTDSINYTFQTQYAANTTSGNMISLAPTTKYFYKIYAVTEGGLSNVLIGNQTTLTGTLSGVIAIPGTYATITAAIAALATSGFSNSVVLELQSSYTSSGETFPITIPNNLGTTPTKTITLRPAFGASSLAITSNNQNGIINFNGSKYFKIDGRPGGTGSTIALTINNDYYSSTGGGSPVCSAISFSNDACNDTLRYCNLTGNANNGTSGVIVFATTAGATGNDSNSIENCNIHGGIYANPYTLINCYGTSTKENNSNTIANNNLYDFLGVGTTTNGILINNYNTDFRITGNHIYQSQSLTASSTSGLTMYGIYYNYGGGNITISNNYIGGSAPYCGGSAWQLGSVSTANRIIPIVIGSSTTLPSTISGNTIANYLLGTNSGGNEFVGISASGLLTINGNTIGSSTGTGNIMVVSEYAGSAAVYGISASGTITNNVIGSFDIGGTLPTHAVGFCGILGGTGNITITNNLIGSTTTANSINASNNSTNGQGLSGISTYNGLNNIITNNTISNFNNLSTSNNSNITGIYSACNASTFINTIINNNIQNLSTASSGIAANTPPISGVFASGGVINISQNSISNLYSTNTTAGVFIQGIFYSGTGYSIDTISSNFIHSISIVSSSTSSNLNGIYLYSGGGIFKNNMIQLGIKPDGTSLTAPCTIYGINKQSGSSITVIHNSIYIGGAGVAAGSVGSACIYKNTSSGSINIFYNNIFYNARTNASTGGNHYTVNYANNFNSFCNNNLFYTGVPLACMIYANGTTYTSFASYKSANYLDSNSAIADPRFVNITGNSAAVNLHINSAYATPIESFGSSTYTATDDYDGQLRASYSPVDVGADAGNFTALTLPVKWLSFEGKLIENRNVLCSWQTASEMNNDYFEIERSVDGSQFTAIGKVKGNGTINNVSSYQFTDHSLSSVNREPLTIYYRLKQTDIEGNFDYSNTIAINLNETKDAIIISPNPFTNNFELQLPTNFNYDDVNIDIKDIQGRTVFTKTYSLQNDQSKILVEANTLNTGIYFVNFTTKDGVSNYQKLVK
ncbi:MAG: T9SS type A sorting domain-containing protein, partial [Bacteroidota bacterium]